MRHPTPFFPAFGCLLFGRPPRRSDAPWRTKVLGVDSLSHLRRLFGTAIPETLLAPSEQGPGSRQRVFSPLITFWAFLSQVLSPNAACREAVRKVQAWWKSRGGAVDLSQATSAYCQARARLEDKTLHGIHAQVVARMEAKVPRASHWLGRRVKVVDGTTLSMPDTAENQAAYPQHSGQKKGCGFPLMKVVGILSLASGALLHFARGTLRVSENALFAQLWPCLDQGDVLLADRGFCSFATLASLWRRGIDCVMRVHRNRHIDFRKGKALGPEDRLMVWQKCPKCPAGYSREDFAGLPSTFTVRQIRLHVGIKGWRTRTIVIVTTLLDPVLYPADALRALYLERWSVELRFREIKITLALDVLRCLTPAMIEKELFMHVIAYNLVRSLMQHASLRHDVALCRLSFKGTLDSLRHFADAIEAAHGKPRRQAELLDHLLELIAKDRLPLRPHRHEPRAKKRRPKNYYLLSRPRHQMRTPSHRNRPKKCLS